MPPPDCRHRILYVGRDLALLQFLRGALAECRVVFSPGGSSARALIGSEISYALFVLDEELPSTTGQELARFARGVSRRERTPIIILSEGAAGCDVAGVSVERPGDPEALAGAVRRLLAAPR